MTAAELIAMLQEVEPDAAVRVIGRHGNHDIFAAYMGQDRGVYVVLADVEHRNCGTSDCCGAC